MPLIKPFTGPGSTASRRRFWDQVTDAIESSRKLAGRNVTIDEHPGKGTVINVDDTSARRPPPTSTTGACCVGDECSITTESACIAKGGTYQGDGSPCDPNPCTTPDCTTCDDLPPTNPTGPPVHINITVAMSGTCNDFTFSGSVTYDQDLGFGLEGPVEGHNFCAHNILDNSFGDFWTGNLTRTCTLDSSSQNFGTFGLGGLLGRDVSTCEWWLDFAMPTIPTGALGACGACSVSLANIFQMIASPGDPSNTYVFTVTSGGVTATITMIIS